MYLRALLLWYLMRTVEGEFFGSDQFKTNVNVLEKGVHNLYNGATKICDFVHRKVISDYYKDLGLVPTEKSSGVNWHEVAKYFIGYLTLSSLLLLLAVCVPIIFSIICCCRSRGRCGRDNMPREKERDRFVRFACSLSLFAVTIAACICLFFAFTSNDILSSRISEPHGLLSKSIANLRNAATYRDNLIIDLLHVKNDSLSIANEAKGELTKTSYRKIFEESTNMKPILLNGGIALNISQRIYKNFYKYKDIYHKVSNYSSIIMEQLANISSKNKIEKCPNYLYDENISNSIKDFQEISIDIMLNIRRNLSYTQEKIISYRNDLKKNFTSAFLAYDRILDEVDGGIRKVETIDEMVAKLRSLPLNRTIAAITSRPWSDTILQYEYMRFGISLGICLLIKTVLIIFFLSVFIPCFCIRKGREKKFISAEIASTFLVLGTGLGILAFSFSLGLIIVLFLSGGVTYSEFCRYTQPSISNLKNTPLGNVIDAVVNERILKGTPVYGIAVTDALYNCPKNISLYKALNLESVLHSQEYFNDGNQIHRVGLLFEELGKGIIPINISRIYPNRHQYQDLINKLKHVKHSEATVKNLTNWLHDARVCLKTARRKSEKNDQFLLYIVIKKYLDPVRKFLEPFKNEFSNLTKDLTLLSKTVEDIRIDLEKQVKAIGNFKQTMVHDPLMNFLNLMKLKFRMDAVKHLIFEEMGKCSEMHESADELVRYGCNEIVQALNAFWVALGISLLLLLLSFAGTTSLVVLNRRKGKNSQCYKELNNAPDSPRTTTTCRINRRNEKKLKTNKSSDMLLLAQNQEETSRRTFDTTTI